jgi:hypothetical protein
MQTHQDFRDLLKGGGFNTIEVVPTMITTPVALVYFDFTFSPGSDSSSYPSAALSHASRGLLTGRLPDLLGIGRLTGK